MQDSFKDINSPKKAVLRLQQPTCAKPTQVI